MWNKLFGGKKKEEEKLALPSLPAGFKQTISNSLGSKAIPVLPDSAQRIFMVVTDPDSQALDFVAAIEGDEGLSSKIIKIANSVYYDRGNGSQSVVEAVATIGTNELRNILGASTLSALFPSTHPLRDQLWEHNVAVAVFSRELAARKAAGRENEAFLGGLLHDVGKLLLLEINSTQYEMILKKAGRNGSFTAEEEEVYPFNHCELGQFIGELWNFSDELKMVMRLHHDPLEDLQRASLPLIVKAADLIAHKLRIGFPSGLTTLQNNASLKVFEALEKLEISSDGARNLIKDFGKLFDEEKERLQMA
ncbi:MAG: HDOD domain-containing protein [Bdellovibrionales bacterium]|nr:HDOD domain-containing protein [Bdellovibrionales bacterium]